MVQLLHKLKIRASDGPDVLMKVVKNPVTNHFPPGCIKIGTSDACDLSNVLDGHETRCLGLSKFNLCRPITTNNNQPTKLDHRNLGAW